MHEEASEPHGTAGSNAHSATSIPATNVTLSGKGRWCDVRFIPSVPCDWWPINCENSPLRPQTIAAMRKALEKAGVEFTNVKRPGVRMNLQPKLQPGKG